MPVPHAVRTPVLIVSVVLALAARADIHFVTPQPGSQTIGVLPIEVTTDVTGADRVEFFVDGTLVGVARTPPYRIVYDFGTDLASHEIRAKVYWNGYRDSASSAVRTAALTAADSLDVDVVEVPLRARATRAVTARDFTIRENGVEQNVREVLPQRAAAHFVFVIDRSLSMGDGKLAAALAAIDDERHLLRADDRVSAILFNHSVTPIRPFHGSEKLAAVFGEITPSGGTSLRDALASMPENDRTYAIVITDGGDRNSELSEEEALRRISGTRTIVDAIVLGRSGNFLSRAAANTGGTVVGASAENLRQRLHDLIVDINSRYLVIYQSHGTPRGWRSIKIASRNRGVEIVNARKGYYAR